MPPYGAKPHSQSTKIDKPDAIIRLAAVPAPAYLTHSLFKRKPDR
jgi:hypothetical protein